MAEKEATTVNIKNKQLVCPICANIKFRGRKTQMNTTMATLFNLDWANKNANGR